MIPIIEEGKFLSKWQYVELGLYLPSLKKVTRIKADDGSVLFHFNEIEEFRAKNHNSGIYTSVWFYDSQDIDAAVRFGPLYFDLDSEDLGKSLEDTLTLLEYLELNMPQECIQVFFTGKKGFHIECHPVALGINPSNNLKNIYRHLASSIKSKLGIDSIDLQVYDNRRMWRLSGSSHQDSGLHKNVIQKDLLLDGLDAVKNYCLERKPEPLSQHTFSGVANQWFREFSYEMEIEKERSKDFIGYFNKHGSAAFKKVEDYEKEFTPKNLLENCSAIKRLWEEAVEKKHLDHEARLFLCSILTYSEDSIKFLHRILSNCDDYNFEKTDSHIQDWIRRREIGIGGRPYTCARANASGVGCMECNLESRSRWIQVGDRYIETEEKMDPSPIRFAYRNKVRGGELNV